MEIDTILYGLRAIGIKGIALTFINSFYRDIIEYKYSKKYIRSPNIFPGDIRHVTSIESGVYIEFTHASVEILFLSTSIVRISWEPGRLPFPYKIVKTDWEFCQPILEMNHDECILNAGGLRVLVGKSGDISFQNDHQHTLRLDNPPMRNGTTWQLTSRLKPEEHIYGLGERASSLNLRPGNYSSWNSDVSGRYSTNTDPLYIGTPIYLSLSNSGSHLVYFENSFKSRYRIEDEFVSSFDGGMLRYYIIFGPIKNIYQKLSDLIGRPCLPPLWSLGYQQSRWGYRSETDIREVVNGFEKHDLPLSAIHLDIDYMDDYRIFTFDPDKFPDIENLTSELDAKGIKVVISINPAVKQDRNYKVYSDGLFGGLFCKLPNGKILGGVSWSGWSVFPDFSKSETRKWWSDQFQSLINAGISGFWLDMNEPSSFSAWGDITLPGPTHHDMDGYGGNHLEVHNLYGLLMTYASYEGVAKYSPQKRPWLFSRAGWAGLQKYAWNWTGDIDTSWTSLKQTIPTILGLGLSGHTFSGGDIGGFNGNPDAELYLRWFQMSAFLPLFRTHSAIGCKPREPWIYGEPTTSIIRNFLRLRYKLLPYYYTLVWDSTITGMPLIRPLFWEDTQDPNLWDVDDEFLLGDGILIAPVVSKGAEKRLLILPPGLWYSFWDDRQFIGPGQFELEVSAEMIPIFIKEGTIF